MHCFFPGGCNVIVSVDASCPIRDLMLLLSLFVLSSFLLRLLFVFLDANYGFFILIIGDCYVIASVDASCPVRDLMLLLSLLDFWGCFFLIPVLVSVS